MAEETQRQYRDGGYGWVIVMSAFFVGFITDGIRYSFGTLLVDMVELFQEDRWKTAIVGALMTGIMDAIGPLAGSMCDAYGYRIVSVAGALLSSAGLLASVFVNNFPVLYITYGLMCGAGFGMMYLPACVCIICNFDKLRALATGVSVCSSGVGMFVFNILTRYLLDTYGLRGTFLILSGICLNGVIPGLLLNDPEQVSKETGIEPYDISQSEQALHELALQPEVNGQNIGQRNQSFVEDIDESHPHLEQITSQTFTSSTCTKADSATNVQVDLTRETGFDNKSSEDVSDQSKKNKCKDEPVTGESTYLSRLRNIFIEMWILMKNVHFLAFLVCDFFLNFAFVIPIHLLPDEAESLQMSKQEGAWLVSAMGIVNILSRIVMGLIGDRKFINRFVLFVCLIMLTGIFTGLSPLLVTFELKMVYACIAGGMLTGGYVTLETVVLADIVGPDDISKAYGLVMFVVGISGTLATPVGGWLFDITGKYDVTFIIAGIVCVLSGVILLLPHIYRYCRGNKQQWK